MNNFQWTNQKVVYTFGASKELELSSQGSVWLLLSLLLADSSSPRMTDDYPSFGDSSLFGANAHYPFGPVRGRSGAIPTAGKISERPCMRLHAGLLRRSLAPAPLSEDARRPGGLACDPAPARGRVRRVGRCTLGLGPQKCAGLASRGEGGS